MHRLALCLELPTGAAPDWVELIPAPDANGIVRGRDGRDWLFDAAARQQVLDAYASRAVKVVLDREHSTQHRAPKGEEAPAAAWLEELQVRDGALWGQSAWTPRGAEQVTNREYRYLSPVFDYDPATKRIARLVSAGLTNTPNLHLSALNSEDTTMSKTALSALIAGALGLAAAATEDDAVAAIGKLKGDLATAQNNEQTPSLERFVPRSDYDAVLARANNAEGKLLEHGKQAHATAVDASIKGALQAGKITPAAEAYHRSTCADEAGLKRFQDFVGAAPVIAGASGLEGRQIDVNATALNAEEQAVCAATGVSEKDFLAARGVA